MRDLTICYICKLGAPHVRIPLKAGKPRGECVTCRNAREQIARDKSRLYKDFYDRGRKLTGLNYRALAALSFGAYPLTHRTTKAQVGYIVVKSGSIFISIWNDKHLLRPSLYGISVWLSDMNIVIGDTPIALEAPNGVPVSIDDVGIGLPLENVADKLVMFNLALQDHAYRKLKAELGLARRNTRNLK